MKTTLNSQLSTLNLRAIIFAFLLLTASAFAGPVSHFGMLKVCGSNICGEKTGQSTPIFFKGPSLFWSDGVGSPFYGADVVDWFVDNMEIGIIRIPMGIRYYGEGTGDINDPGGVPGYYFDQVGQKNMIKAVIDAAIINDIYVIVDWHSHNAHQNYEKDLAKTFFMEMANEYQGVPNIIWEVYNEPMGTDAGTITTYSNNIINALRSAGNNNLVLVGSRAWSQNPSEQASNYGSTAASKNVAFTFHFYAAEGGGSGHDGVMTSANSARTNGYAVFGSEWGYTEASGKGSLNQGSKWTTWMDNNKISNCNWSVSNHESSSMFTEGTSSANLSTNRLSTPGGYFQTYMGTNKWTAQIPSGNPKAGDAKATVRDGESVTVNLSIDGEIVSISEPKDIVGDVYGTAEVSGTGIKYTTTQAGSPEKVRFTYTVSKNSKTTQGRVVVSITDLKPKLTLINDPISVSRKAPTKLSIGNTLKSSAPKNDVFTLQDVTISDPSKGTVGKIPDAITGGYYRGDTILFTPSPAMATQDWNEAIVTYTIRNNAGMTSTASVVLHIQNRAPTVTTVINRCMATIEQGAEETRLTWGNFSGQDPDKDSIWFRAFYLSPDYPGELVQVAGDTLVYKRNGNTNNGDIIIPFVATDGLAESNVARTRICLNGSGPTINVTAPTEIPGYDPSPIISQPSIATGLGIKFFGKSIEVNFAQSGLAKLDVYSLSGKNMGTLLNGFQNAGSSEVSLKNLNLQRGVYILRLKQGSQVKTLRIVN